MQLQSGPDNQEVQHQLPKVFENTKEMIDFKYTLKTWPKTIGEDFQMEVNIKDGKEFSWNWQEDKVELGIGYLDQVYDIFAKKYPEYSHEQLKEKTLKAVEGAAIHEGLHRKYTVRPTKLLGKEELQELFSSIGFAHMNNSIEDPRINSTCHVKYPALYPRIQSYIDADIAEGGDLSYHDQIKSKKGWVPLFCQCGSEYMMFWNYVLNETDVLKQERVQRTEINQYLEAFFEKKSYKLHEEVENVLRKTAYDLVRSFHALPRQDDEIFEKGQKSMKLNKDVIWPVFRTLIEKDEQKMEHNEVVNTQLQELLDFMGSEMGQQLLEELMEQMLQQSAGSEEEKDIDGTSKEQSKGGQDGQQNKEGERNEGSEQGMEGEQQGTPVEECGVIPKEPKNLQSEDHSNSPFGPKTLQETIQDLKGEKGELPIDSDQLSPELKEKFQEFIEQLPEEKKKELQGQARRDLEDIEDLVNSTMKPQGIPDMTLSHASMREEQEQEQDLESPEDISPEEKEIQDTIKEMKESVEEVQKSQYEKDFDWIEKNVDFEAQRDAFRLLFMPNYINQTTLSDSGNQGVDTFAAMQRQAAKAMKSADVSNEIWVSRETPKKTSYAFTFLVDLSGSMRGEKIQNTLKALTFLNEIFSDPYLGSVEFEILGFHEVPKGENEKEAFIFRGADIKGHRERVNQKISTMLDEVSSDGASYNDDGPAIRWATERLQNSPQKKKFLIVFSDGNPEYSSAYGGLNEDKDTKDAIRDAAMQLGKDPFCFFLGTGGSPEKFYNIEGRENVLRETDPKQFIEQLADLLRVMMMYPNDYMRYIKEGALDIVGAAKDYYKVVKKGK